MGSHSQPLESVSDSVPESEDLQKVVINEQNFKLDELKSTGEIDQKFDLQEFMKLVDDSEESIVNSIHKQFILVLGNTGSGKSTTITYLLGAKLQETYNKSTGAHIYTLKEEDKELIKYPKIGHSSHSETLYPCVYSSTLSDLHFCDSPGFIDNRGPAFQIIASLNTRAIIQGANKIHGVIVVIERSSLFEQRSANFRQLALTFHQIFKNIQELTSILFIITKSEEKDTKERIGHRINFLLEDLVKSKKENEEELVKSTFIMYKLMQDYPQNIFLINLKDNKSREEICKRLTEIPPMEKSIFKFGEHETLQVRFDKVLFDIVSIANIQLYIQEALQKQIQQYQEEKKQNQELIHWYQKIIQDLETKKNGAIKLLKENDKHDYETKIQEKEENLKMAKNAQMEVATAKQKLEEEYDKLNTDEPVLLWDSGIYKDDRIFFGKIFSWSVKKFSFYSQTPYIKVEKLCKDGSWSDETVYKQDQMNHGQYNITYTSNRGKNGYSWVKLYTKKKLKPEHKARLEKLQCEIQNKDTLLKDNRNIIFLEKVIAVNRSTLQKLSQEEIRQQNIETIKITMNIPEKRIEILNQNLSSCQAELKIIDEVIQKNMNIFKTFTKILRVLTRVPMGYHVPSVMNFLSYSQDNKLFETSQELCSLTRQPMKDPMIAECGHVFENKTIKEYNENCKNAGQSLTCPWCRKLIVIEKLRKPGPLQKTDTPLISPNTLQKEDNKSLKAVSALTTPTTTTTMTSTPPASSFQTPRTIDASSRTSTRTPYHHRRQLTSPSISSISLDSQNSPPGRRQSLVGNRIAQFSVGAPVTVPNYHLKPKKWNAGR